jgi:autoinducer 2-binding protein LuxP
MKFRLLAALICALLFSSVNAQDKDFYTIDQFKSSFPQQVELMKDFSETIRSKAQKTSSKKEVKIAVIYPGIQLSDYWVRSVSSFKKRMDEIGIKYVIKEYFTQIGQHRKQTADIKKALSENPDFMIFTLDVRKHQKLIGRVLSENKTKLILQNITTPLRQWKNNQPLLYVGFDHLEGSKILANYYSKKLGGKGSYSMFYFQPGYVSEMRGTQFIKYLTKNSALQLSSTYHTQGKFEKSKKAALALLKSRKKHPNFIYACSTDIALGTIAAIKELKLKNPPMVNGWGGGSKELEEIANGNMDVTVMRMNDDNGVAMAEAIRMVLDGKEATVPTIYSGDFVLVEKGISKGEIQSLKKRAFRYSGYTK